MEQLFLFFYMDTDTLYDIYAKCNFNVSTDTRSLSDNCLFFALKGANFNGNKFAADALKKGAAFAVIDEAEYNISEKTILVPDVLSSLQQLASFHKSKSNFKVIALTGSNGKTTTKELITCILKKLYNVCSTKGNLNNHIGVPLTLLSTPNNADYLVLEMGANHPGEIKFLSEIGDPDCGLITNIGNAHIEGFGSLEGVLKAKTELFDYLISKKRPIFYNTDDDLLQTIKDKYKPYIIPYSFKLEDTETEREKFPMLQFEVLIDHKKHTISSNLTGNYNIQNINAAVTLGRYFKIPMGIITKAISEYIPGNHRSQIKKTEKNTLIVDCYNANPSSMQVALDNFNNIDKKGRIAILGEMKELGQHAQQYHKELIEKGKQVANLEKLILIGNEFSFMKSDNNMLIFKNTIEAKKFLEENKFLNKIILLKGSRTNRLEDLIDCL